jgi:hypothetical protein
MKFVNGNCSTYVAVGIYCFEDRETMLGSASGIYE